MHVYTCYFHPHCAAQLAVADSQARSINTRTTFMILQYSAAVNICSHLLCLAVFSTIHFSPVLHNSIYISTFSSAHSRAQISHIPMLYEGKSHTGIQRSQAEYRNNSHGLLFSQISFGGPYSALLHKENY